MFKSAPRTAQGGFTLIELVVVIVILGILAAFAVPRFARLDAQARTSSVRALEGSLRSSSAMTHGLWLVAGNNPANVAMEGANVAMTAGGYPTRVGIQNSLIQGTVSGAAGRYTVDITGGATLVEFRLNGARVPANCMVRYTEPVNAASMPNIVVDTSAC